jgi:hypothetical protein
MMLSGFFRCFSNCSYIYSEDIECFGEYHIALGHFKDSMHIYQHNEIEVIFIFLNILDTGYVNSSF